MSSSGIVFFCVSEFSLLIFILKETNKRTNNFHYIKAMHAFHFIVLFVWLSVLLDFSFCCLFVVTHSICLGMFLVSFDFGWTWSDLNLQTLSLTLFFFRFANYLAQSQWLINRTTNSKSKEKVKSIALDAFVFSFRLKLIGKHTTNFIQTNCYSWKLG